MKFKQFIKSKWFPVLIFVLLEIITFLYGSTQYPYCLAQIGAVCPNLSLLYLIISTIPNLIISLIIYYLIKKFHK